MKKFNIGNFLESSDYKKLDRLKKTKSQYEQIQIINTIHSKKVKEEAIVYFANIKTLFDDYHWDDVFGILENSPEIDKKDILEKIFKNSEKFKPVEKLPDIPSDLQFGIEIEVGDCKYSSIEKIYKDRMLEYMCKALEIPENIINKLYKADFHYYNDEDEKNNKYDKWVISREMNYDLLPEVSSPILTNDKEDLEQINAICLILKSLGAKTKGRNDCGLHINVGANYLKCNTKAIENLTNIWGKAEKLLFLISNEPGDRIRWDAINMAIPIKYNVEHLFKNDGSVNLETEEDLTRFIYNIQARDRIRDVLGYSNGDLEIKLFDADTEEKKFEVYKDYLATLKSERDDGSRYRSINFNHMKWNAQNSGRIEIRIFNSTLDSNVIQEDILLIAKLFETSLLLAENPDYKKEIYAQFLKDDLEDEERLKLFLDLLFNNNEYKHIFYKRWESNKNDKFAYAFEDIEEER